MPTAAKPRVLIDALAYDPHDGGFATALEDLLATCRSLDDFDFVVVNYKRHEALFRQHHLPFHSVSFPYKLRFFASLLLLPLLARQLKADAVHCEISALPDGLGVGGSVTAHDLFFLKQPVASGRSPTKRLLTEVYWRRLYVHSLRRAQFVKAISETTAHDVHRVSNTPTMVIAPRVEQMPSTSQPRILPEAGAPLRLVFLGSVVPRKNLPLLLNALQLLERDWRLDIVGNLWWGSDVLAQTAGDPRISVHGFVSQEERDRLLNACHVLVAPSLYEGFCYPVAEAISRGALAFTSDIEVFREYVPDECRFPLDQPRALADMLDSLTPPSYQYLRELCRPAAQRFTPEAHIDGHRELFRRLTNGGR